MGLLLAKLAGWLVRRGLRAAGVDDLAERWRVNETLARAGLQGSLAGVTAVAVRIILSVIVVFAAVMLLGLEPLSQSLNEALLFLPNVIAAAAIVLAGVVLAALVRERVDRLTYQMDFPVPLGQLAQVATLAIFAITAAAQLGVSAGVLVLVVAIVLAAVAGTFAIAFASAAACECRTTCCSSPWCGYRVVGLKASRQGESRSGMAQASEVTGLGCPG